MTPRTTPRSALELDVGERFVVLLSVPIALIFIVTPIVHLLWIFIPKLRERATVSRGVTNIVRDSNGAKLKAQKGRRSSIGTLVDIMEKGGDMMKKHRAFSIVGNLIDALISRPAVRIILQCGIYVFFLMCFRLLWWKRVANRHLAKFTCTPHFERN